MRNTASVMRSTSSLNVERSRLSGSPSWTCASGPVTVISSLASFPNCSKNVLF